MNNQEEEIPSGLIQRALACDWYPENEEAFQQTQACAETLLDALVRSSFARKGRAGDRLPPNVLEHIFSFAIAASGHAGRINIRDASRKFRCVVFVSQTLWSDVTTLPTNPPSFMMARDRAWWTNTPSRLHLDNSNAKLGLQPSHVPSTTLLLTTLGHLSSLIVEHKLADIKLLRILHRQRFFPDLEKLVLSSGDRESWGPLPTFSDDRFDSLGVPVIEAPRLRTVHLRTVLLELPDTHGATDLLLSGRTRGTCLRPRLWNKWPVNMVHNLLARNDSLTVLRLIEVVRTETIEGFMPTISLPLLEVLVVCSPSAKEPVWVLDTIDFPDSTHLSFHIGHKALSSFDKSQFYHTLGPILKRRTFHCVTAVSSTHLSGVLLSAEPRTALPVPKFDENEVYLQTTEIAHTRYEGMPGAIDVFVAYLSVWIPETPWHDIYSSLSPYVEESDIHCVELNPEAELYMDRSLLKAAQFEFVIKELRLWNASARFCTWDSIVKGLTGWTPALVIQDDFDWEQSEGEFTDDTLTDNMVSDIDEAPGDEPVVRDIVELMLVLFPDTTHIYDCGDDELWYRRRTLDLVEAVHRSRRIHD